MRDRPWPCITVDEAVSALRKGKLIVYPTEGVYGLGCDPFEEAAVQRLLTLKRRPVEKGLILVAASISQIRPLVYFEAVPDWSRVEASWPGPVTWLLPATCAVPEWIRGNHAAVAIRVSAHPVVQALCTAFGGPIVSTSANPGGEPPAMDCASAGRYFAGEDGVAGCVAGTLGGLRGPTPIYDALTGVPVRPPAG